MLSGFTADERRAVMLPVSAAVILVVLGLWLNWPAGAPLPATAGQVWVVSRPSGALVTHLPPEGPPVSLGRTPVALAMSLFTRDGMKYQLRGGLRLEHSLYTPETWQGSVDGTGQVIQVDLHRSALGTVLVWLPWVLAMACGVLARQAYRRGRRLVAIRSEQQRRADSIAVGGRLDRYVLERRLGEGAMAEVFLGRPEDGSDLVAIKVLHEEVGRSQEFKTRFEREAGVCQTIQHPRVVRCHGWGLKDGRYWMAQDYLPGGNLRDMLKRGLRPPEVRTLLKQITEGLAAAHEAQIVHRDLKPDNILLDSRGEPVVGDFGLARGAQYETITGTEATLGTPAYMPPEHVMGERCGPTGDLYSLGCIAYEMLTGQVPFAKADPIQTIMAHASEPPPDIRQSCPGIPEDLAVIVMRLLEKQPTARYADARELLSALQPTP